MGFGSGPGGAKISTAFRYNHHAKQLTTTSSLLWHFDVSALTALLRSHQNNGAFNSSLTCAVLAAHHRRQCSARWTTSRAEQHSEDIHARHGARGCSTEWRIANQMRSGKYLCLSAAKRQTRTEKENTREAKIVKQQVCFHHFPPLPPRHVPHLMNSFLGVRFRCETLNGSVALCHKRLKNKINYPTQHVFFTKMATDDWINPHARSDQESRCLNYYD